MKEENVKKINLFFSHRIAFTLIELLVVIAIIGILSGLIIVSMSGVTNSANIAKAQIFSNSLRNALMMNLVSEWKLDQINVPAANQTPDSWSGGNTGTLSDSSGACSYVSPYKCPQLQTTGCPVGNCLSFDGTNDYVSCGSGSSLNPGTGNMTIEAWIKTGSATDQAITYKEGGGPQFNFRVLATGNLRLNVYGNTNSWDDSVPIVNNNVWHHVVGIWLITDMKFFIDGVEAAKTHNGAYPTSSILPTGNQYIGARADSLSSFFNGLIDNVRIYNAAMPTSQIQEQYYSGLNKLFLSGQIAKEEYSNRLSELKSSLAIK